MIVRIFLEGAPSTEPSVTRTMHQVPDVGDAILIQSAPTAIMRVEVLERLWCLYPDRGVFARSTHVDLLVKRVSK
jgi:hypothetical protein